MTSSGDPVELKLDFATLRILDTLAAQWGISREMAAKRAIEQAAPSATPTVAASVRMKALQQLQDRLGVTKEKAAAWQQSVRDARR